MADCEHIHTSSYGTGVSVAGTLNPCPWCEIKALSLKLGNLEFRLKHLRVKIPAILDGIDRTEPESTDGWWPTSTGAEFGSDILQQIDALFTDGQESKQ